MEEQNMVETPEEEQIAPATVFSFGPEEGQVDTDAADPVGEGEPEAEEAETVEEEAEAPEGVDSHAQQQKDINAAIGREKRRIRDRYEQSWEYRLGKAMIDDMQRQDRTLSRADAGQQSMDNFNQARSRRDNIPQSVLEELQELRERTAPQTAEPELDVDAIYEDVMNAPHPKGFDVNEAGKDPEFIQLLTGRNEYGEVLDDPIPAKFAIQIYMANKRAAQAPKEIAERVRAGRALPKSITPQAQVSPKKDWTKVSDEEFLKEKARRKNY